MLIKSNQILVSVVVACLFMCSHLIAQDIIYLQTGEEIKAKVYDVGEKEIKYKNWDDLHGSFITKPKGEIFMIGYQNGDKDVFGLEEEQVVVEDAEDYGDLKITVVFDRFEVYTRAGSGYSSYKDSPPIGTIMVGVDIKDQNALDFENLLVCSDKQVEDYKVGMNGHITTITNVSDLHNESFVKTHPVSTGRLEVQVLLYNEIGNYQTATFNIDKVKAYMISTTEKESVNIPPGTKELIIDISPTIEIEKYGAFQKRQVARLSVDLSVR